MLKREENGFLTSQISQINSGDGWSENHIQIDLTSGQELGRYFWNVQWGRKSRKEREMALGEPYDLLLRLEQL